MKALTVRQPFASRLVHGTKRVENRTWSTEIRGRVFVHAASAVHDLFADRSVEHLPRMAIIGHVQLVDVHSSLTCGDRCREAGGFRTGEHAPNPEQPWFHWCVENPVAFDDADVVSGPGSLGFWDVERAFGPSRAYLVQLAAGTDDA